MEFIDEYEREARQRAQRSNELKLKLLKIERNIERIQKLQVVPFEVRLKQLERKVAKRPSREVINPQGTKLDIGLQRCEVQDPEVGDFRGDARIFFVLSMNSDTFVSEKVDFDTLPAWTERFAFPLRKGDQKLSLRLYLYSTLEGESQIDKITIPLKKLLPEFIDQIPAYRTFVSAKKNVFEIFFRWRHDEDMMRLKELKTKFERFEKLRLKQETNYIRSNYALDNFLHKQGIALLNEWGFLSMASQQETSSPEQTIMLEDNDYFKDKRTQKLLEITSQDSESQVTWLTGSGKLSTKSRPTSSYKRSTGDLNLSLSGSSLYRNSQPHQHFHRQPKPCKTEASPPKQYSDIESKTIRVLTPSLRRSSPDATKLTLNEQNLKSLQSPPEKKPPRISSLNGSALGGFLNKFFRKTEESLCSAKSSQHRAMTEASYASSGIKAGKMIHLTHLSQRISTTASLYGVSGLRLTQMSLDPFMTSQGCIKEEAENEKL